MSNIPTAELVIGSSIYSRHIQKMPAYSWHIQKYANQRQANLARLFPIYSRHIEKTRHIHESCVLAPRQTVDIFKHVEFLRM